MAAFNAKRRIIVHDAAAHPAQTNGHHTEGQHKERRGHQPEVHLSPELAHAAAGCFGEPIINRGEEREDKAAKDRIVKMSDNEVSVMQMKIEGDGSVWRSSKTTQKEYNDRANHEK